MARGPKMSLRSTQGQKGVSVMENIRELLGEPSAIKTPKFLTWVQRSKVLALGWTAMRIWLGVMWIQAGTAKLWGAENPAFLHNNGAGVAGFAAHGVPPTAGGDPSCTLSSFRTQDGSPSWSRLPSSRSVSHSSLGLFTRLAALGSLALLFTYVMSGTASVCAFYAFFAIVILATWRTSSWIGVDGVISGYRQRHQGQKIAAVATSDAVPYVADAVNSSIGVSSLAETSQDDDASTKGEPVVVG